MNNYRKGIIITSIIAFALMFAGFAIVNTHLILGFFLTIVALIPAYIAHVLSRLEDDERRY